MGRLSGIQYFDNRAADAASAGRTVCQWDGRLDNLAEVRAGIGLPNAATNESGILLQLFERHGWQGLSRVIGDWRLAIWSERERSVCLATDYSGTRPLYYYWAADRVLWASSLEFLANWVGVCELDRDYMTEFAAQGTVQQRTPYKGIASVPPGTAAVINPNGIQFHPLWSPPWRSTLRYAREADYEAHLLELFREAVAVRLNTPGTVCAELSGGLDSSAVVCMAHRLIQDAAVPASRLVTVNYAERGSSDAPFYEDVQRLTGADNITIDLGQHGFVSPELAGTGAPGWWEPRLAETARRMEQVGATLLLTGQMGDLVMGNWFEGNEQVAACLRSRKLVDTIRTATSWSKAQGRPVYPLVWGALLDVYGRRLGWTGHSGPDGASLTLGAAKRWRQIRRDHGRRPCWRRALPDRLHRLKALVETLQSGRLISPVSLGESHWSHPYLHRPLVEFMMSIPSDIVYRPHEPRRLMRRAFMGLIPRSVLARKSKTSYQQVFRDTLVPIARALLTGRLLTEEMGIVDPSSFRVRLQRLAMGVSCDEAQLRHLILLELWVRRRALKFSPAHGN